MTKAKTENPEDQAQAVETTQDATLPAPETAVGQGADNPDLHALEAAAAEAAADAQAKADAEAAAAAKAAAEAEADAKMQKKLAAKAAADAKAAATAAARDAAAREARLILLNGLLTTVELDNTEELRGDLITSLASAQGAVLTEEIFTLADITVLCAATLERTLADWAMDARREIMATA